RPQNVKKLFNLRYSSLRNAVERSLGILKMRFPILKISISFDMSMQVELVKVLCCLHNFI
ncbi:unnamed protein product, partial [Tuber aestivum]